jgi:hypothetical protein
MAGKRILKVREILTPSHLSSRIRPTLNFDIIRYNPAITEAAGRGGTSIDLSQGERPIDANAQQSPFLEHQGQNRPARPRQLHVPVLNAGYGFFPSIAAAASGLNPKM